MARQPRLQYAGAVYHVMNRGARREPIFRDDQDRDRFLATLGETCQKTRWRIHAFCLMPNHFHFVAETPQPNLVAGMKWLLGTYTSRFNRRHKEFGHLFGGRYKSLIVDGSGNGYLKTVCDYVHLNPARAGLIGPSQPLVSFPWSSYVFYLRRSSQRPGWLAVERLLGEWRIPKDSPAGRERFAAAMEERRAQDNGKEFKKVERGWYLGGEEFRRELLEQVREMPGASHFGEIVQEAEQARAGRLMAAGLKRLGWKESDLGLVRKGDARKVMLAQELRAQTTMPLSWIAKRLSMGSRGYLTWLLYRLKMGEGI